MCMKLGRRLVDKCESDHSDRPQLHEMLKQLANKLETGNNECNCEKKVNEAVHH